MLDAIKIGTLLASVRQQKGWTQAELAERLNVAHQAVSKWEQGESLPDIMKIPPLAEVLGMTMDDLLSGEAGRANRIGPYGPIIRAWTDDQAEKLADYIQNAPGGMQVLQELAPMMKASKLDKLMEHLDGSKLALEQTAELAPYLGSEALEKLILQAKRKPMQTRLVHKLAPFLSNHTLSKLLEPGLEGKADKEFVHALAPFLPREDVDRMLGGLLDSPSGPFPGEETPDPFLPQIKDGATARTGKPSDSTPRPPFKMRIISI